MDSSDGPGAGIRHKDGNTVGHAYDQTNQRIVADGYVGLGPVFVGGGSSAADRLDDASTMDLPEPNKLVSRYPNGCCGLRPRRDGFSRSTFEHERPRGENVGRMLEQRRAA
jgi:hypothetical protein